MIASDLPAQGSLEVLDRSECLRLMSTRSIARVVFELDGLPTAYPVNIVVHEGDVYFVSGPGGKLEKATTRKVMAIEADDWEPIGHTGWSVLVTGHSEMVTDHALAQAVRTRLDAWAPGAHDSVVRVRSTFVSGRRITRAEPVSG